MQTRALPIVPCLLAMLAGPACLAAEEPGAAGPEEVFGETVQVNVVNVEVYVTDKSGEPVTGLAAEDFELFENGKPVGVSNFYAVEGGHRLEEPSPGGADPAASIEMELPTLTTTVPEDQRLRLVVYIDNYNLRALERKRVLERLGRFLRSDLRPHDRVMLVTYDGSLNIRHPFTSDAAFIAEQLLELETFRVAGAQYDSFRRSILKGIDQGESRSAALSAIHPYAEQILHDLNNSIDGLKSMVEVLAGLPGRKAVLYVSSGLPMVAAGDLYSAVQENFDTVAGLSELHIYDASRRFEQLGIQANAQEVTFYTLDAGGLRLYASKSAEEEGLDSDRLSLHIDSEQQANLQAPLYFLADRTGGRAILNRNDILPALADVAADFRNYYSLGYAPGHTGDGRFYTIKVRVKRKGVNVRHREGYRDKSASAQMSDATRAALVHAFEDNPLGVEVGFGTGERQSRNSHLVTMQVRIPVGKLVLVPVDAGHHLARVRLFIAAMDEDGDLSEVQEAPLGIKIPNEAVEAARGEHWLYNHQLIMRDGRQRVALGVRDEIGAVESVLYRSHRVGG